MLDAHEFSGTPPVPVDELQALIGNVEKKCVLQLLAQPGEKLTVHDFNERFAQAQDPVGYVTYKSLNNLQGIVQDSLSTAGTYLTPEDTNLRTWSAEKVTDSDVADSLAGHNLALTADYGLSLEQFWGKTSKAKTESLRSPQVRLEIFEALSALEDSATLSIPDLAARLGLRPNHIHSHMQRLHSFGFIEYGATELQHQNTSFEITGNPDPSLSTLSQHGTRLRNPTVYAGSVTQRMLLGHKLMEFQKEGKTTFSYEDLIGNKVDDSSLAMHGIYPNILIGIMLREGIIKRHHKTTTAGDQFSEISLDQQQREIIRRTIRFYYGLRDNDPTIIQEGLDRGAEIMQDKRLVAELLQRAYNNSPNTYRQSYEVRAASIGSLLLGGDELSTRNIQELLDEGALTLSAVGDILRRISKEGKVTGRKVGNEIYWRTEI